MRLDWLTLTFGCFDGQKLDLAADGLHVVVGPNEAGKSTVRHAFGEFLYGIDVRTNYDFAVQNKSDLWLKAGVRGSNGDVLEAVRLKKAKDDLLELDADGGFGARIAPERFAGLLGGIEKEEFRQNFAIDHAELVSGGAALLDGKDDASRALFEAQSGRRLGAVLTRLNAEMDRLYKQRASLPTLNAALARHANARAQFKGATLKVADYEQLKTRVDNAEKERLRIEEDLARKREERSRLHRIQQALPGLAKHTQLSAERAAVLAAGPVVGPETGAALREVQARASAAREAAERAGYRLERIQGQLAESRLDLAVLDQAEVIDGLHAASAAVADAEQQAARWRSEAAQLRQRAATLRVTAGAGDEELPPGLAASVEELRRANVALETETRTAEAQVARRLAARDKAASAVAEADATADVAGLKALLKAVPSGLVERLASLRADIAAEEAKAARIRERHELPPGVAERPLPSLEQVTAHRTALEAAEAALENARLWVRDVEDSLEERRQELQTLLRTDAPPTEGELAEARRVRDGLWGRLRAAGEAAAEDGGQGPGGPRGFLGAADEADEAKPDELPGFLLAAGPAVPFMQGGALDGAADEAEVPAADPNLLAFYETAVATADELVDRLRREADRVARRAGLEADIEAHVKDLDRKRAELADRDVRLAAARAAWENLWPASGLPVPEPAAAPVVLAACADLRDILDGLDRLRAELAGAEDQAERNEARLREVLPGAALGATLAELLALGEEERDVREAARRKHEKAEEKLAAAAEELAAAEAELEDCRERAVAWSEQWADTLRGHHLAGDPDDVLVALTAAAELARTVAEAEQTEADAAAAEQRVADFTAKLAAALAACGRPPLADPGDRYAEAVALHRRLEEQRAVQTTREELSRQLDDVQAEIAEAELDRKAAEHGLAGLLHRFGVPDLAELEAAVRRTAAAAELTAQLKAVEESLHGTGLPLAALQAEAAEWEGDPDRLAATLETAAAHLADREAEYGEQISTLAELKKDLRAMDGSARAALASEKAAEELATVVEESEEYLRLFLARKVLLDCMEEYREANQGPVLARAEHTFRALTAGRFDRLVAEADDKGRHQLSARRSTGEQIGVDGMSEGTRDQLYLALRLASLDRYAAAGRTMPLLLDDVFMTFDDGRAQAGLKVLDGLADTFQVILFTHHPHLAALAQATLPAARVHVHELPLVSSASAAVPAQHSGADRSDAAHAGSVV